MRKIPLLFFCVILILSGCSQSVKYPTDKFKGSYAFTGSGYKIKGDIYSVSNNLMTISVKSPSSMKGYRFKYKNDKLSISYNNMKLKSDREYLPKEAFSQVIFNVIRSLKKDDNCTLQGEYNSFAEYKGSCDSGEYTLKASKNSGLIRQISLKEYSIHFKISSP